MRQCFTIVAVFAFVSSQSARAENSADVPKRDPAMSAAYVKAASTLDQFLTAWRRPPTGAKRFALKVGVVDVSASPGFQVVRPGADAGGAVVEYFWIGDLRETARGFEGAVHNEPDHVRGVHLGQKILFEKADIADWTYFQNGRIVGNATACPALAHASQDERRQMREQYGLVCD